MTRRLCVLAISFWCVSLSASALDAPGPTPDGRHQHDRSRGVVLFGGESDQFLSDTWVWDGETWRQKFPKTSPPARVASAMAYDKARHEVVLFGGAGNDQILSDTWVWNGENWKQKFPAHHPPSRYKHGMAYDSAKREIVAVGGFGEAFQDTTDTDTWVWNGEDWKQRFPADNPGVRGIPANVAYDEQTRKVVLFGGELPFAHFAASDTWEWDGCNWQNKTPTPPATSPDGLFGNFSVAYDVVTRKIVLFGVSELDFTVFPVTWLWNGSTWERVLPHHSPQARGHMATDIGHRKVVLFDGDNTSTWNGRDWSLRAPSSSPPFRREFALTSNPDASHREHADGAALDSEPDDDQ